MPPFLALVLYVTLLAWLFRHAGRFDQGLSPHLYLPFVWMFVLGTRSVSEWLNELFGVDMGGTNFDTGSPLDRNVMLGVVILGFLVLRRRREEYKAVIKEHGYVALLLVYALLSVLWADAPLISLKRWVRGLGTFLMVLVIVTEPRPLQGLLALLRRFLYVMLPLSLVLIYYFRDVGILYAYWDGSPMYVGVCGHRTQLGRLSLLGALFFSWEFATAFRDSLASPPRRRVLLAVSGLFVLISLRLLLMSSNKTSLMCLAAALGVLAMFRLKTVRERPAVFTSVLVSFVLVLAAANYFFDAQEWLFSQIGREATLTGRTELWRKLLDMQTRPIFGFGYGSFWIAKRMDILWDNRHWELPTEAHNGFLGVYLDLGIIGVLLWLPCLLNLYRKAIRNARLNADLGCLQLMVFVAFVLYNVTESNMSFHSFFLFVLLAVIFCPAGNGQAGEPAFAACAAPGAEGHAKTGGGHPAAPPMRTHGT